MALEVNGQTIATTDNGYLEDANDWNEDVAKALAADEGIEMTQEHMDVVNYLRDEHFNNGGNEPNERTILKDMGKKWGKKSSTKNEGLRDVYNKFIEQDLKPG